MSSTSLIKRQLSRIELGKCFTPSKSINISPKHQSVYGRIVFFSKTFLFCPCKIHCRWKRKEIGVEDTVRPRRTTYFCMGCRQDTAETKAFHCSRIVNMKQKCFSIVLAISWALSLVETIHTLSSKIKTSMHCSYCVKLVSIYKIIYDNFNNECFCACKIPVSFRRLKYMKFVEMRLLRDQLSF